MSHIDDFLDGKIDRFVPQQQAPQRSRIDAFLDGAEHAPSNSTASDLAKSVKVGVQRLPGMVTGLADLPFALAAGARPFTRAADALGEVTGFQPGKWADETKFSAGYEQGKRAVDDAWRDGDAGDIALSYLKNPGYSANQVVESLPSMVAGGLIGRGLLGAGRVASVAADAAAGTAARAAVPGLAERALGKWAAPVAGGVGEGAVTAGQQMQQYTGPDQQRNARAALGAGLGTAALGVGAGRVANRLGLETAETAIAKMGTGVARAADEVPLSARRRILGGMVSEALLQELPQSAQEQMWQNWADGKPLMDGVLRQSVEGAIAGGVMGAGANVRGGRAGVSQADLARRAQAAIDHANALAEQARQADPTSAWATEPGAAAPVIDPATGMASPAHAPGVDDAQFTTSPGAASADARGVDYQRDVDTSGLRLQDPAEVERARAATMDYAPVDATPQWDTEPGATPLHQGLDMPAPEFDTSGLSIDDDPRTPSQRMGIDPAAGPLSKAAATAVDSGATPVRFLGATGRALQPRQSGPGVTNESNVIDVQGRVVDDRAIGTPRRLTAQESARESGAIAFRDGVPRAEIAVIPNVIHRAQQLRGYDEAARQASPPALPAPSNLREGLERIRAQRQQAAQAAQSPHTNPTGAVPHGPQADQAQQGGTQQPQARNQEAAGRAAAPAGAAAPNGGSGVQADGLNRPQNWRTSMLRAGPVARAMGLQTKGKRLAQVVAEIDAADARRAGVPQDGTDLSAGRLNRAWSVFAPETGSLGVPRDQMPQIKAEHRGALVNFLKARGIDSRAEEVPANDLKPTQAEFSPAKVEKARAFKGGDRSILVSSDGYVVDGHHQWLAKRANGEPVKVIRLKAPIQQVLQQVAQFPSTTAAGTNLGTSHATARDLRLADERAPGAGAAAPHGTGESVAGAAPAVGTGQRPGDSSAQPAPAVPSAVSGAGGASEPAAGVGQVVLQNRDRSSSASITQMNAIAENPDYLRTGPSRTMDQGAPVVFGDLPQGALLGRAETVADGSGNRVKVRYAVVDAGSVLPSNAADGTPSMGYAAGMPGKLRAVAGNARAAGLIEAFNRGTAKTYQQELTDDAQTLGIDPQPLAQMQRPMLVRLMDEADITPDMGDRTNIQAGAAMSAVEQAANDVRRVDVASLQFDDAGNPTRETLAAFINQMPVSERGAMLNSDGTPTKQAIDRLVAAAFKQAYGNDALVELAAQATDPEARTVISALASVAGDMAQLAGTGEFDIRQAVSEAAQKAVNARRRGLPLQKVLQERDLQDTPEMLVVAQFMADNIRSAKRMADGLRAWASLAQAQVQTARENERSAGLFGETPVLGRERIFERLGNGGQTESAQRGGPQSAAQDTGRQNASEREREAGGARDGRAGRARQQERTGEANQVESNDALVARENEAPYETDLFGDPVPAPARRAVRAQSTRTGLRGNVQPAAEIRDTQTPEGQYFVRTIVGHETQRRLGADLIRTPQDAAQATAYLYKSAVERFDAIVTDKGGKPLAVVGGFKGAISQTAVYPGTVVAEAVRVPGAARVWFSHNHPSGNSMLSRADENLMHVLSDAFRGSGIEPQGLMAVSNGKFSFLNANGVAVDAAVIPSAESAASTTVPVIERELAENGETMPVGDPGTALRVAKDFHKQGGDGILLLNAQNVVAAWVPITDQMRGALRHTGALNAIYRAISESNAAAAILVHDGNLDADHPESRAVTVGNNIAAALAKVDVRPLDSINVKTGKSLAQTGLPVAAGPMFSRSASTQASYEARIDALFAGGKAKVGTRILDSSDVMGLLGYPKVPLMLNESHLRDGLTNHPEMTEAAWKKVPGWIENPAAVYTDPRHPDRLTVIAPETLAGYPVVMVIEPNPSPAGSTPRPAVATESLLVTAYAKTTGELPAAGLLAAGGRMKYVDTKNAPEIWRRGGGQFPKQAALSQGRHKILTEKQLGGYRRANDPALRSEPADARSAARRDSDERHGATQALVDALTARWGRAPEIVVARNMQDAAIPQRVRDYDAKLTSQGGSGEVRGFVYKGKVYLLSDHLANPRQIAETLFHEVLGHHGLRGAFGDRLDGILRQVGLARRADVVAKARSYGLVDKALLQGVPLKEATNAQVWAAMTPDQRLTAAEEVLAEMAEQQPQLSFVQRAVAAIRTFLRELGLGLQMTDAEIVRNYLTPAREFVTRQGETVEQAVERAMAQFGREAAEDGGVMFSRSADAGIAPTGRDVSWSGPAASAWDDMVYKMQDKHIDTKRVLEGIRAAGIAIADDKDVYLREELYHERAAKRTDDFVKDELQPLVEFMQRAGLTMAQVEEYLHARHAKEANTVIAQRNDKLPDGGSGMTNAEAGAVLASFTGMHRAQMEKAAGLVDGIIRGTRQAFVDYDLESQDTVDGWANMYQHYVPLMREQEGDGMAGLGTGQGFSIKGRETKGRTGSTKKVIDVLANVVMQRERAIVRGEKNRVAQAAVGLARVNPNDGFWEVRSTAPKEQVFDPKQGKVVERADPLFKGRANVLSAKVRDSGGHVVEQYVVFNEDDPRAMRMAQSMKNLDAANLEGLLGETAKVTRYLAAINTQYNPIFGLTNIARDVSGAALNLASTPLAGQQREVVRRILPALSGIYADARARRKGGDLGTGSEWARLYEDFRNAGGATGFRDQFRTSADRAQAIQRALDPSSWAETNWGRFFTAGGRLKVPMELARKAMAPIFDWLEDYNTAMENGTRLAAYKVALDAGMTRERAASLAKNLTTNFNRKGQVAQQAGALYAFFNASVQGTARIGQTLFDMEPGQPKTLRLSGVGKTIVAGGVSLGIIQAMLLAASGFDDDEPPDFIRERNLVIPTGGKSYITIPMPLGFHVLPNLGRIPTEFVLGGFKKPVDHVVRLMGLFSDTFNPIGNAGLSMQTLAPTVLDPFAALAENKDFSGRAIAKVAFDKTTPGHALARDTASVPAKLLAEAVNYLSGGTQHVRGVFSPTPDQIDYLLGQVTGGVGREASKLQQSVVGTAQGDDVPWHKVPALGRFFGNADSDSAKQSAYYRHLEDVQQHAAEVKGLRLEHKGAQATAYAQTHPVARLNLAANAAQRDIRQMQKRRRELEQQDAPRAQVREMEQSIVRRMQRFSALVETRARAADPA